ncbi:MAG: protein-glutamate O-methyltransferase CheR [Novosphingobium sp.]|nr:protein-glutamate O-methyltransferase CheR [Novosphingobium sp.]
MKPPAASHGKPAMPPEATAISPAEAGHNGTSLMDAFDASMPGVSPGVFDEADFRAIAEIAHHEAGIVLPAGKAMLVYSRLAPLVRASNCATFPSYVLRIREDRAERQRAIGALTTCNTGFYRDAPQFDHFAREVRPAFVERLMRGGKVRLWSAGCASGEEPWSLLMTLLGHDVAEGEALSGADLRLLATDIATPAIARARTAIYRTEDLAPLPEPLRRAWTCPQDEDTSMIAPPALPLARFRALNLLGEWPMQWQFDTIFCRHVIRHFDGPAQERLLQRLAHQLEPGGWLYLGLGETVTGPACDILSARADGVFLKNTDATT